MRILFIFSVFIGSSLCAFQGLAAGFKVVDKWQIGFQNEVPLNAKIITGGTKDYLAVLEKESFVSESGRLLIYDLDSKSLDRTISIAPRFSPSALEVVPKKSLVGFYDFESDQLQFWNFQTGKFAFSIGENLGQPSWQTSPNQNWIAIKLQPENQLAIYSTDSGEEVRRFNYPEKACRTVVGHSNAFTISEDLEWLYVACHSDGLQRFHLETGRLDKTYLVAARKFYLNPSESQLFIPQSWNEGGRPMDGLSFFFVGREEEIARTPSTRDETVFNPNIRDLAIGGVNKDSYILAATPDGAALYFSSGQNLGFLKLEIERDGRSEMISSGLSDDERKGYVVYFNNNIQLFYLSY
jgi:hypothetical protein